MIKQTLFLILLVALAVPCLGETVPGVDCALNVYQLDETGKRVLLSVDTTTFLKGMLSTGFITGFSTEVEMTEVDTIGCEFMVHLVTLGPPSNNYSRKFRVEYSLPAQIDGIRGKDSVEYIFQIQPLGYREIDTSGCGLNHRSPEAFTFSPSGYMDFYYHQYSFGEFYWELSKDIFEKQYRLFKGINNFNLPGKYLVYLCPCPLYSVIWDDRFGMMVDPTRNAVFGIYSKDYNSVDPFLVLQASVFKNYGYSPAFLSEGLAGYLSLAEYQMKSIVAAKQNIPLDSLLDTYTFLSVDPALADKTTASLTKYLINEYHADKFLTMYKKANDLNLREVMVQTYGKSISEIETEWLNYIDTVRISRQDLFDYSGLAEAMFDYSQAREYNLELLNRSATLRDTIDVMPGLINNAFSTGNYYQAKEYQAQLTKLQPDYSGNYLALAAYQMMSGKYDETIELLNKARATDSSSQIIEFNFGLHALNTGQTEQGWQTMAGIIINSAAGGPQGEARALYGNYLAQSDLEKDKALAIQYCTEAINVFGQSIRSGDAAPETYLWSGIAHLGLGDTGNAWDQLWLARFIDTRPFYVGMANLWLGKVADVMGDHDVAQELYGMVISGYAADYHQAEARRLIKEPYRQ